MQGKKHDPTKANELERKQILIDSLLAAGLKKNIYIYNKWHIRGIMQRASCTLHALVHGYRQIAKTDA